mmetsp:Transcript_19112/g.38642  ORF Transcript_19112/g.38642 Transcript_19112/m.38642 type:complete len:449 (+) Transcript_19112:39-1385(+)
MSGSMKEYRPVPSNDPETKGALEDGCIDEQTSLIAQPLGYAQITGMNFFAFPYSLILSTMGLVTLPLEVEMMYPENKGLMLGVMLGVAGISQLVCPLVGYFSDRCTSKVGRRIPYMLGGSILVLIGDLVMMWARSNGPSPGFYIAALFVALLGLNITYSAFTALNADFVPKKQMGIASGVMAILQLTGSFTGFALLTFVLSIQDAYLMYAVSIVVGVAVTILSIVGLESPLETTPPPVTCRDIVLCYTITPSSHGDFFWVFVIRLFYYLAVSIQAFLLYYLHDTIGVENAKETLVIMVMVSQLVGACVSVPVGGLSDVFGRKNILMYTCVFVAIVYTVFMMFPPLVIVYGAAICYGVANSALMTVEYALACDTLPNKKQTARDLGLWGVAAFLGGTFGPLIMGPVLHIAGYQEDSSEYSKTGYIALFCCGTAFILTSGSMVKLVRGSS